MKQCCLANVQTTDHRHLLKTLAYLLLKDNIFVLYLCICRQFNLHQETAVVKKDWPNGMQPRVACESAASRTSAVHMSPLFHTMGTFAMDKNDHPNGI